MVNFAINRNYSYSARYLNKCKKLSRHKQVNLHQKLLFLCYLQLQYRFVSLFTLICVNKEILHQAIAFLARREHVNKELKLKLLKREYSSNEIDEVLLFLTKENYQSDVKAAECIFRNRVNKGYGWRYIENEMSSKGVSDEVIRGVYQEFNYDWYSQAKEAYQKKYANTQILDNKDRAKRIRFLQYRGFSFDEIQTVLPTN